MKTIVDRIELLEGVGVVMHNILERTEPKYVSTNSTVAYCVLLSELFRTRPDLA